VTSFDHRVDHTRMAAERCGQRKDDTDVWLSGLGNQPGQVFAHVSARREHERMHDHGGRSLLDAASEPSRNCGLSDLHVRRLHDASGAETLLHEHGDFIEERVRLRASTTVVDQENRAASVGLPSIQWGSAHRHYLGPYVAGVKKRWQLAERSRRTR